MKRGRTNKISKTGLSLINQSLKSIRTTDEFVRKTRPFTDVKRYKASEFQFFLLYCEPVVLKNNISEQKYRHFLKLHVATFILSNNTLLLSKYLNVAKCLLEEFVIESEKIYKKFFVVYNVHSLLHVCDYVQQYGCLNNYSCFVFESYLGKLKPTIRGKNLPLQQAFRRQVEINKLYEETVGIKKIVPPINIPIGISKLNEIDYVCKKIKTKYSFTVSISFPNNFVMAQEKIYKITKIMCINNIFKCVGQYIKFKKDFFSSPVPSSYIGIFYVTGKGQEQMFLVDDIKIKYMPFHYNNGYVLVPLNHLK